MIQDAEGVYTRTQAFNFLKNLLGIPKRSLINEEFFMLFFIDSGNFYLIKKPEDIIKALFTQEGIVELNKTYYQKKLENNNIEADEISKKVMDHFRELLCK
ncbi:MAG: hypothetical protein NTU81_00870 [Candidatus Nomurabacteria bacterium]|nr:hypothetical protein [Candidatus Nomurabacteria bacterium]